MQKLFILFFALITSTVFAKHVEVDIKVLTPKKIQSIIGSYPAKGSDAEAEDFRVILSYQATRTVEDCQLAEKDSDISLASLFGGENGVLSDREVKKMKLFLIKAYVNVGANSYIAKHKYKRPRPYLANTAVKPCIGLEKSFAYPSGHTLMAHLFARVLSKVYPEREDRFMARASQYALNRVIGGVHHPSDVQASIVLGDYLADKTIESDKFLQALRSL
jgi:acid phosphatase (class A)